MSQPVQYILTEGTLTLPEAAQDESVTILKLPQARATLVITRAFNVKPGEEKQYIQQQLAKVKRDMKKFVAEEPQAAQLGSLPAQEVAFHFQNQQVTVHQRLLTIMLSDHLLALTLSRTLPFDEAALVMWQAIKAGFIPAEAGEA
ncbi:DcrB-related protein [Pantoea sp. FN0307]|uniref:DcrB-related protein n=1 Tax=Pantoea sp. FN0307 TaxID=3418560 RepID=UPI003CF75E9C